MLGRNRWRAQRLVRKARMLWVLGWVAWVALSPSSAQEPATRSEPVRGGVQQDAPLPAPWHGPIALQAQKLRGLSGEAASLAMLAPVGGELAIEPLALLVRPTAKTDGARVRMPFFVEIDGASVLETNQAKAVRLEVYAYVLDAQKRVVAYSAEVFGVDIETLGEAIWQGGLKYYGHLDLPPGEYVLRILVRNFQSKAKAVREQKIEVPEPKDFPAVLPPIFPDPANRDAWLAVREWSPELEPYPLIATDRAVSPAARAILISSRNQDVYLFADLPQSTIRRGSIEVLQGEKVIARVPLDEPLETSSGVRGLSHTRIRFAVPEIPSGRYELRFRLNTGGKDLESPATAVLIISPGAEEREMLWTDLRSMLKADQTVAVPEDPAAMPQRVSKKLVKALAERYQKTLAAAAKALPDQQRATIFDFESNVLTEGPQGALAALLAGELAVAEKLAEQDVESLIPLLLLHQELHPTYRRRRLYSLAVHTRDLIEQLAELYAKQGQTEGSRVVAGRVLTSLAGDLQAYNLPAASRRLFQRALELDARNQAALLGLATSLERYGERAEAAKYLEALVTTYPSFSEGLLRLALNLIRTGQTTRAKQLLEAASNIASPRWVRAIAFQELARGHLLTGDLLQAVELLERAVELVPEQQTSLILLAHLYDRLQQPAKAIDILARITPAPEQTESARKLYDSWPQSVLEQTRSELSTAASGRQDAFQHSLEALTAAGDE